MRQVIWKYELKGTHVDLHVPVGARIICVHEQRGVPMLWAIVDLDAALVWRTFHLVATGEIHLSGMQYVGTVFLNDGKYVLHLFET